MSVAASPAWTPARARSRRWPAVALILVGGGSVTAAAAVLGNGDILVAMVPLLLVAGLCAVVVAPLRYPLVALIFLALALDVSSMGPLDSPLAPVGRLLADSLNKTVHVPLPISGEAFVVIVLLAIHLHRVVSGSRTDTAGRSETPPPLHGALAVSFVAVLALCVWGDLHGGSIQMAKTQVQNFVLLLLLAYLSTVAFRGLRDYYALANFVIAAACIKAMYAIYVMHTVVPRPDFATSHGDSVLFAGATVALIVRFAEQPIRRHAAWCLLLLPLLILGMLENERRVVWIQVFGALAMFWTLSRRTRAKRFLARTLVAMVPLFVAYVVVGWNSQARVFAPIQTYRSVNGDEMDASTLYRETENYNLLKTLGYHPFLGSGFGNPFTEFIKLPDISFFREYQYLPHNSFLGLWAFTGVFGFSAVSMALVVGAYFARRAYLFARAPDERVAAFMVLALLLIHIVQCWGDIGFSERRSTYLVGPALALAGQLAIITGAWRGRSATRLRGQ